MVFGPESFDGPRLGLPAENFLLGMLDGGRAMTMCVWTSGRQQAEAVLRLGSPGVEGRPRTIGAWEIDGVKDKPVWVAFLEGAGIWHAQAIPTGGPVEAPLDWQPPFPARWRGDVLGKGGFAESWNFSAATGDEGPTAPAPDRCPCRLDGGRALVRLDAAKADSAAAQPTILVYPIDRDRSTPLATFCPMDVLRNTLGVGPCQYILQTEGLPAEASPTPDAAMDWVEGQFKKKKEKRSADEIRQLLAQMVEHVKQAQARIDRYALFAKQIRSLLETGASAGAAPLVDRLGPIAKTIAQVSAGDPAAAPAAHRAAKLADEVVDLIGKKDALADCQRLGLEIRRIGAVQDRALSKCRMSVRWLKQQAHAAAVPGSQAAELARQIEAEAEKALGR